MSMHACVVSAAHVATWCNVYRLNTTSLNCQPTIACLALFYCSNGTRAALITAALKTFSFAVNARDLHVFLTLAHPSNVSATSAAGDAKVRAAN